MPHLGSCIGYYSFFAIYTEKSLNLMFVKYVILLLLLGHHMHIQLFLGADLSIVHLDFSQHLGYLFWFRGWKYLKTRTWSCGVFKGPFFLRCPTSTSWRNLPCSRRRTSHRAQVYNPLNHVFSNLVSALPTKIWRQKNLLIKLAFHEELSR